MATSELKKSVLKYLLNNNFQMKSILVCSSLVRDSVSCLIVQLLVFVFSSFCHCCFLGSGGMPCWKCNGEMITHHSKDVSVLLTI